MDVQKIFKKKLLKLICTFLLCNIIPAIAQAYQQYNRQEAVGAQTYASRYCTDGWFFRDCSEEPVSVTGGSSMSEDDKVGGCDCSHFVSCAIGNEPDDEGGGLDVDHPYSPYVYGYPGVEALGSWLVSGPGELVQSGNELEPGDIIQYDIAPEGGWDHSVVYVGNSSICAHSKSRLNDPWSDLIFS